MDNKKAIDLADYVGADIITFYALRKSATGAVLWDVYDTRCNGHRYIVEGETGEFFRAMARDEEEAIAVFLSY